MREIALSLTLALTSLSGCKKTAPNDGASQAKIIGGSSAFTPDVPFQRFTVLVRVLQKNQTYYDCTGSIVGAQKLSIITAAHCFESADGDRTTGIIQYFDHTGRIVPTPRPVKFNFVTMPLASQRTQPRMIHPQSDFAVIHLATPLVGPGGYIDLPSDRELSCLSGGGACGLMPAGAGAVRYYAVGAGDHDEQPGDPRELRYVQLPRASLFAPCLRRSAKFPAEIRTKMVLNPSDSGGPLVAMLGKRPVLLGTLCCRSTSFLQGAYASYFDITANEELVRNTLDIDHPFQISQKAQ